MDAVSTEMKDMWDMVLMEAFILYITASCSKERQQKVSKSPEESVCFQVFSDDLCSRARLAESHCCSQGVAG